MTADTRPAHTRGPWRLHKADDTLVLDIDGREVAEACGSYEDEAEWPRMEANARLIAAAPDLLAALELATREMRAMRAAVGPGLMTDQSIATAEAALSKATGSAIEGGGDAPAPPAKGGE